MRSIDEIALLTYQNTVYFSHHKNERAISRDLKSPHSATTQLIQGIWEQFPHQALLMLRQRIYTTESIGPMVQGMVKMAAKRVQQIDRGEISRLISRAQNKVEISFSSHFEQPDLPLWAAELLPGNVNFSSQTLFPKLALQLATLSLRNSNQHYKNDRPVGALLISPHDDLLAWAYNTNGQNRTLHAEVNLMQLWCKTHQSPLPLGSRIITSLEPCKMCVGMIAHCSEDPHHLRLEFLEQDSGPAVRQDWIPTHFVLNSLSI